MRKILKKYGILVPEGIVIFNKSEISKKLNKNLKKKLVIKAQIHAGGRGKAGGIKIIKNLDEAVREANIMLEKTLITPQTGPNGKKVKRLYIEETCDVAKEFYLSCLVDRSTSKIAFISSAEGGMDIEEVAKNNPEKITTVKIGLSDSVNEKDIKKIWNTSSRRHSYI